MDTLNAHKGERVRELVEGTGCELPYLPTCSPELNPLKEAFARVRAILRIAETRPREALIEMLNQAISAVTTQDAHGCFKDCGYKLLASCSQVARKLLATFRFALLPVGLPQHILDFPVLRSFDGIRPVSVEPPLKRQARFLHHPSRGSVDSHRLRHHSLHPKLSEALADQRPRSFGGVTLALSRSLEPVAELDLAGVVVHVRPELEPPKELPSGLLDGRPEAKPLEAFVVVEEPGQRLVSDHFAGGRFAAGEGTHDLGIAVEVKQVVRIGLGEPTQQQSSSF
jgi:hypothetical protein